MKSTRTAGDSAFLNEIIKRLRTVPKTRLRIVRDIVGVLAEAPTRDRNGKSSKSSRRASLLNTPFCGMWQGRSDIVNGQSYGSKLRQSLESRGDRS